MSTNQKMIGIETSTKELIDKYYKQKGFSTRAKYIKSLVEFDTIVIKVKEELDKINPELTN